ncbi:MAG: ABC transporter ATP-binding protein [Nitrososphaerales archaeon]
MSQVQLSGRSFEGPSSGSPLLQVKDLTVRFEKKRSFGRRSAVINAVNNVSFSVNQSEVVAIVGESGSGKTTLARSIVGLLRPSSGSIMFDGSEITRLSEKQLHNYHRSVQVIHQDPFESLTPRLDVYTTLSIPIRKLLKIKDAKQVTERVQSLLQEVSLDPTEVMRRYPHQLSGGQRQRVNIARALAPEPRLLIADEPITMLDAAQRLNILYLLSNLKTKRSLTVLFITHDLASARLLCPKTMVMYLGKLVEEGNTEAVLSKPNHPYVEMILDAMPNLRIGEVAKSKPRPSMEEGNPIIRGCVFNPRCSYRTEICKQVEPPLIERSTQHLAACHNPLNS